MKRSFALLVSLALFVSHAAAESRRPNVLFLAVDDLRPELGTYGHKVVRSPNIDRLARSGWQFDRAYCQLALCNPSRASLLTGRRPESIGVFDLATFVREHDSDVVTLPQHFKNNGYRALSFGKIFHTTNGNKEDLASWSERPWKPGRDARAETADAPAKPAEKPVPGQDPHANELPWGAPDVADDALSDGKTASAAIEVLRKHDKDQPLFMAVGFHKPHLPFVAPKRYWDLYDPKAIELAPNRTPPKDAPPLASNDASELRRYKDVPKTGSPATDEEARRLIHGYYACVSYTDAQVGRLLDALEATGLADRTIVVLWGDHGYHLGDQGTWNKRTNWEIATRVPLIIARPGSQAGGRTPALVELVDLYPTLAEMCSLPLPPKLEGTSLLPLMRAPNRPWKRAAFSVYQKKVEGMGLTTGRAMRTDQYRFIEWSAKGGGGALYELYDHVSDPHETVNVADVPENRDLVANLTKQLNEGWTGALPTTAE